jgi:NhaP-type Na+/H+ or K+/H+ antiporter
MKNHPISQISGIICGPYLLGILSAESVVDLNIIESACLAVIGLAAGAELDLPSLTRSRKQVSWSASHVMWIDRTGHQQSPT